VDDRFFENHEYNALTPDQKNILRLTRLKHGHVGKSHSVTGNNNGKNNGKGATIKSLARSIAALSTNIYKFSLMMMMVMMMMMNLQMRKKELPIVPMLL
jgi:hypothetical protein